MSKENQGAIGEVGLNKIIQQFLLQAVLAVYLLALGAGYTLAADGDCPIKQGSVSRAMFTTQIENREPVNQVLILQDKYKKVYFFTELHNLQGRKIIHLWEHNGHVFSQKEFDIKGPRWRVYSSLELNDKMLGRWTAIVSTKDGCPIKAVIFQYVATNPDGQGSAILKLKK